MPLRARVDGNQAEIVRALRAVGCSVFSTATIADGFPDLVVGWRGETFLMEVKGRYGTLTDDQRRFQQTWRGALVAVVRSPEAALRIVGVQ